MSTPTSTEAVALAVAGRLGAFSLPEGAEAPHLWGTRCKDCAAVDFPPTRHCPRCSSTLLERVPLSRRGELHSWSTVYQDPGPSFIGDKPYTIVTVDLPEGVRVVSTLSTPMRPEALHQGLALELEVLEVGRDGHGAPVYDFRFRRP